MYYESATSLGKAYLASLEKYVKGTGALEDKVDVYANGLSCGARNLARELRGYIKENKERINAGGDESMEEAGEIEIKMGEEKRDEVSTSPKRRDPDSIGFSSKVETKEWGTVDINILLESSKTEIDRLFTHANVICARGDVADIAVLMAPLVKPDEWIKAQFEGFNAQSVADLIKDNIADVDTLDSLALERRMKSASATSTPNTSAPSSPSSPAASPAPVSATVPSDEERKVGERIRQRLYALCQRGPKSEFHISKPVAASQTQNLARNKQMEAQQAQAQIMRKHQLAAQAASSDQQKMATTQMMAANGNPAQQIQMMQMVVCAISIKFLAITTTGKSATGVYCAATGYLTAECGSDGTVGHEFRDVGWD